MICDELMLTRNWQAFRSVREHCRMTNFVSALSVEFPDYDLSNPTEVERLLLYIDRQVYMMDRLERADLQYWAYIMLLINAAFDWPLYTRRPVDNLYAAIDRVAYRYPLGRYGVLLGRRPARSVLAMRRRSRHAE